MKEIVNPNTMAQQTLNYPQASRADAIDIRKADRADFPGIARLIARQNKTPELQCIHSGEGYESILQTMIKWADASEICFAMALQDSQLVGAFGCEFDESSEGYIEFLGVRSDLRGQGLGNRLLLTALDWLFWAKNVSEVGLTVADDQTNARSLYEKAGFGTKYTGLSARKDI